MKDLVSIKYGHHYEYLTNVLQPLLLGFRRPFFSLKESCWTRARWLTLSREEFRKLSVWEVGGLEDTSRTFSLSLSLCHVSSLDLSATPLTSLSAMQVSYAGVRTPEPSEGGSTGPTACPPELRMSLGQRGVGGCCATFLLSGLVTTWCYVGGGLSGEEVNLQSMRNRRQTFLGQRLRRGRCLQPPGCAWGPWGRGAKPPLSFRAPGDRPARAQAQVPVPAGWLRTAGSGSGCLCCAPMGSPDMHSGGLSSTGHAWLTVVPSRLMCFLNTVCLFVLSLLSWYCF